MASATPDSFERLLAAPPPHPLTAWQVPRDRRGARWMLLPTALPRGTSRNFWNDLNAEFHVLAMAGAAEEATVLVCPDLAVLAANGGAITNRGAMLCLPHRPYQDSARLAVGLQDAATQHDVLARLLREGRVLAWEDEQLRPPGYDRIADPFGVGGLLMLAASLGAKDVFVPFRSMLEEAPRTLGLRRYVSTQEILSVLPFTVRSFLDS